MSEHAQAAREPGGEQRLEDRPREPEHDEERAQVRDQQVLRHVRPYDLAAHVRERRREPGDDERYADPEGGHPQRRDRAALARQRPGPQRVGEQGDERRQQLERLEDAAPDSERDDHGIEDTPGRPRG